MKKLRNLSQVSVVGATVVIVTGGFKMALIVLKKILGLWALFVNYFSIILSLGSLNNSLVHFK